MRGRWWWWNTVETARKDHLRLAFACEGGGVGSTLSKCEEKICNLYVSGELNRKIRKEYGRGSTGYHNRIQRTLWVFQCMDLPSHFPLPTRTWPRWSNVPCLPGQLHHDAICWQLEPVIWGLQHNTSFIWTRVARQQWVRPPHGLWLQCVLTGHVGDGRKVVGVCVQHEHRVTWRFLLWVIESLTR